MSDDIISTPLRADGHGWIRYSPAALPIPYHAGCIECDDQVRGYVLDELDAWAASLPRPNLLQRIGNWFHNRRVARHFGPPPQF